MFESEYAKIATVAPRRLDTLPGLHLRDALPKTMLILPVFFAFVFLVFPLAILNSDPAVRLELGPALLTEGHVVAISPTATCRGAAARRLKYVFSSDGREYRGAATVCEESAYYSATEGDAVAVRYLRRDPAINALHTGRAGATPPIAVFFLMPIFFLVLFAAVYWPALRDVLRAKRWFQHGRLATGQVVFVKKRSAPYWAGMPSVGAGQVFVSIPASASGSREVIAPCRNEWLINQLSVGSTVHVAYADDQSAAAVLLDAYWR